VASAGDVNGDGYSDVIIGAYLYNTANPNAGKAYLSLGSGSGLQASPSWTSSGDDQGNAHFGVSVASAGDVNGDGYSDVIIGAYSYDTANTNAGKAYLYLGSSSGLEASWTSSGDDQASAAFGNSVASAGDVNGDGYSDVIIGAYAYDTANSNVGKAYVYLGKPLRSGIFTSAVLDAGPSDAIWLSLCWNPVTQRAGTRLKIQVAMNRDGKTWKFRGPDGKTDTYYTEAGGHALWSGLSGRYFKYRVHFSTDDFVYSPVLNDVTIYYVQITTPIPPSVTVISPNGGEDWMKDKYYPITWSASGNLGSNPISIYYSTDNGNTWTLIASDEVNDGVYNWTVPSVTTANGLIKVEATDLDGNVGIDTSDSSFAIDPPPPTAGDSTTTPPGDYSDTSAGTPDDTSEESVTTSQPSIKPLIEYIGLIGVSILLGVVFTTTIIKLLECRRKEEKK
jgi:hypothetical protein